MSDPILDKLNAIVGRYVPLQHGRIGLQDELRALLAEVAIEYTRELMLYEHGPDWRAYSMEEKINKRFGIAMPNEEGKR
jgi:hypothetical protein